MDRSWQVIDSGFRPADADRIVAARLASYQRILACEVKVKF